MEEQKKKNKHKNYEINTILCFLYIFTNQKKTKHKEIFIAEYLVQKAMQVCDCYSRDREMLNTRAEERRHWNSSNNCLPRVT
jgi:hypothetical protein